jgi:hypothetical protein
MGKKDIYIKFMKDDKTLISNNKYTILIKNIEQEKNNDT